jgi:hypothetical protein
MLQRQWDLNPLCIHALRVGAIGRVVNRHCLPIGERSTSNRSSTATDRAIELQMRISGPPMVLIVILATFEYVRSAAHSQQASSCALNVVKLVWDQGWTCMMRRLRSLQNTGDSTADVGSVLCSQAVVYRILSRCGQGCG